MPRIGMNPSRGRTTDYHPARVTLAVLTYLPHDAGYFRQRFDVTRLCIESLIANTPRPYDLLIFDNGSCPELVDYLKGLRDQGLVHYLILAGQNIGKVGALQIIFRAAPGEIVAYTDDDIFFLPGWLEAHLAIIDTFPKVGAVTGLYVRPRVLESTASTLAFAAHPEVELVRGRFIPQEWEEEYIQNSGRTWESYSKEIEGVEDLAVRYKGLEAMVSAHHFQFVAPRQAVLEALPQGWSGRLMGQMVELEAVMDRAGYLRLSTRKQTVRLLGNSLSPEMQAEAEKLGLSVSHQAGQKQGSSQLVKRLVGVRWIRHIAQGCLNRLYAWLNA